MPACRFSAGVAPLALAFLLTFALMAAVERRAVVTSVVARPAAETPGAFFLPPPRRLFCAVFCLFMSSDRPTRRSAVPISLGHRLALGALRARVSSPKEFRPDRQLEQHV